MNDDQHCLSFQEKKREEPKYQYHLSFQVTIESPNIGIAQPPGDKRKEILSVGIALGSRGFQLRFVRSEIAKS